MLVWEKIGHIKVNGLGTNQNGKQLLEIHLKIQIELFKVEIDLYMKKHIGLDAEGTTPLHKSRVVVEADGKLVTAFPQKEFKELADHEKIRCH